MILLYMFWGWVNMSLMDSQRTQALLLPGSLSAHPCRYRRHCQAHSVPCPGPLFGLTWWWFCSSTPSLSAAAVNAATCSTEAADAAASKQGAGPSAPPGLLLGPAPLGLLLLLLDGPVLMVRGLVAALLPRLLLLEPLLFDSSSGSFGCALYVCMSFDSSPGWLFLHQPSCRWTRYMQWTVSCTAQHSTAQHQHRPAQLKCSASTSDLVLDMFQSLDEAKLASMQMPVCCCQSSTTQQAGAKAAGVQSNSHQMLPPPLP